MSKTNVICIAAAYICVKCIFWPSFICVEFIFWPYQRALFAHQQAISSLFASRCPCCNLKCAYINGLFVDRRLLFIHFVLFSGLSCITGRSFSSDRPVIELYLLHLSSSFGCFSSSFTLSAAKFFLLYHICCVEKILFLIYLSLSWFVSLYCLHIFVIAMYFLFLYSYLLYVETD